MDNYKKRSEIRLQKYIAECGICSRRSAEKLIEEGRVCVNSEKIQQMGYLIDPDKDFVTVDGKTIHREEGKIYIMLNKPVNVISAVSDPQKRKTVLDCISKKHNERIYPIGRLDYESTGLILLTNDGELTNKITHPRKSVWKTYIAALDGILSNDELRLLREGVVLDGRRTNKAVVKVLNIQRDNTVIQIKINEGRNRQIRRMIEMVGHKCLSLHRISIGDIELGNLKSGEWRYLTRSEKEYLFKL